MKVTAAFALAAILAVGTLTASPTTLAQDAGHCNFTQQNMFAGPFRVCKAPADAAACEELGQTDDNRDAVHGEGSCAVEGIVGTCDLGAEKVIYYEGEAGGLEIGCGFQGGDWISAE